MYGKVFEQMYEGTLASRGPWEALVTFQQFIVLANRHGEVDMTPDAISRRTTIPLEIIQKGIESLEQVDPDSRTPDEDGRRIARLDDHRSWGWRIVNYDKYRKIRSEEERREYQRVLMANRRKKEKESKSAEMLAPVSNVSPCSMQYVVKTFPENKNETDPLKSEGVKEPVYKCQFFVVTDHHDKALEKHYPHVNRAAAYEEMAAWCADQKAKKPKWKGIQRPLAFFKNWCKKEAPGSVVLSRDELRKKRSDMTDQGKELLKKAGGVIV